MRIVSNFARALSTGYKYVSIAVLCLMTNAGAETSLEQRIAASYSYDYQQNEQRLVAINKQLESLPIPYPREPTGTGGFISTPKKHPDHQVALTFRWKRAHSIDAVALFPLRLFMDEVYAENLYWPKKITIETKIEGSTISLAQLAPPGSELRQSLPQFVRFDSITTDNLVIRCTGLQQHPDQGWYAAGFAEVSIFSDHDNLAPQAKLQTNGSREGLYIIWSKFLTDDQTPLGIPQITTLQEKRHSSFRVDLDNKSLSAHPLSLTLHYTEPIDIDALRFDPASRYFYGQGFPERFSIDLLNAEGTVLKRYTQYAKSSLRNPALNPHFARFDESKASAIQIKILKEPQAIPPMRRFIELSEITPMYRGLTSGKVNRIEMQFGNNKTEFTHSMPASPDSQKNLSALVDGYTESGRVISQRAWSEGLHQREKLMQEQLQLQRSQQTTLTWMHRALLLLSIILITITIGGAAVMVIRIQIRTRKEIRITRTQIASNLHDDIGSNLGTIILQTERLQEESNTPNTQERLQKILRLTKESVLGIQEALQATAPEIGHNKSLATHLHELTELMLGQTKYAIDIAPTACDALTENVIRGRFMLFYKEALHNAKKHAQCTQVDISLKKDTHFLILSIADNGIGIDANSLSKARTLRTLKKRAEWLGGTLTVDSAPEQGTRLTLKLTLVILKKFSRSQP